MLRHRLTRPASPRYQRFQRVLPVPPGGGVLTHSVCQSEKTKVKNSKNNIDYSLFYSNISFIFKILSVFALLPRLTLACLEMSRDTMSGLPSCEARWRGVTPCSDSALADAPYCSRLLATSTWFCLDAICRAV